MSRNRVVLPAPDGPTMPTRWPGGIIKVNAGGTADGGRSGRIVRPRGTRCAAADRAELRPPRRGGYEGHGATASGFGDGAELLRQAEQRQGEFPRAHQHPKGQGARHDDAAGRDDAAAPFLRPPTNSTTPVATQNAASCPPRRRSRMSQLREWAGLSAAISVPQPLLLAALGAISPDQADIGDAHPSGRPGTPPPPAGDRHWCSGKARPAEPVQAPGAGRRDKDQTGGNPPIDRSVRTNDAAERGRSGAAARSRRRAQNGGARGGGGHDPAGRGRRSPER